MAAGRQVRGMTEAMKQAGAGLELSKASDGGTGDMSGAAAEAYKREMEKRIAALEAKVAKPPGTENQKERMARGNEVAELKRRQDVVACKVMNGMEPKNGFFVVRKTAAPEVPAPVPAQPALEALREAAKEKVNGEKEPTKKDGAGLSPAEMMALKTLRQDVTDRLMTMEAQLAAIRKRSVQSLFPERMDAHDVHAPRAAGACY